VQASRRAPSESPVTLRDTAGRAPSDLHDRTRQRLLALQLTSPPPFHPPRTRKPRDRRGRCAVLSPSTTTAATSARASPPGAPRRTKAAAELARLHPGRCSASARAATRPRSASTARRSRKADSPATKQVDVDVLSSHAARTSTGGQRVNPEWSIEAFVVAKCG
jgi:hypothetical protein